MMDALTDDDDPLAALFDRSCTLAPTHRVEERLQRARASLGAPVDARGAALALGEIRACQDELRAWARGDRRRSVDACLPLMARAATDLADALHRRRFPRCAVPTCAGCAAHRQQIRRGAAPPVDWARWSVAAADAQLARLDALCGDRAAIWRRPDAERAAGEALAWLAQPTRWAQPVEDDAEAARLLGVAAAAEAPAVELWRQLHSFHYPYCAGGAACPEHREPRGDDARAAAQARDWAAHSSIPSPPRVPPPSPATRCPPCPLEATPPPAPPVIYL